MNPKRALLVNTCVATVIGLTGGLMGCAGGESGPSRDLVRACVESRMSVIRSEWARFESLSQQRVVIPDWRSNIRLWARVECDRGRPMAAFHPDRDTATVRRYY